MKPHYYFLMVWEGDSFRVVGKADTLEELRPDYQRELSKGKTREEFNTHWLPDEPERVAKAIEISNKLHREWLEHMQYFT